eukprot:GAHX01001478.1.p1 GENE.GAHX01001478.1~~GAHX01001478.1.p1  ORF type:complete len:364 (-),score=73.62 GAHX01001478.1:112-1203(-)
MSYYQLKSLLSADNGLDFDLAHLKTITSNISSLKDIHDCIKMLYDFLASNQQVDMVRCLWVIKNWSKLDDTFRDIAATSLNTKIKCLVNYKGVNDPLYGTSLHDRIHMLSEDCLDVMFVDNTQRRRESASGIGKSMVGTSSTNYNQNYEKASNKTTTFEESSRADPYSTMRQNLMDKLKTSKKPFIMQHTSSISNRTDRLTDSNQIFEDTQHSFLVKETNKFSIHKNTKSSRIFHVIRGSRVGPLLNTLEKNKLNSIFSKDTLSEYIDIFTKYEYNSIQGTKLYESFLLFQKTSFFELGLQLVYSQLNDILENEKIKCKSAMSRKFLGEIVKKNEQYKPKQEEQREEEENEDKEESKDREEGK